MTNFFKALAEFKPHVAEPPEYRIYYDAETGVPYSLSTEKPEGTYIVVTKEQFESKTALLNTLTSARVMC